MNLGTAEEVLEACDWLMEAELYVNPRGVRMVRGYAEYSGNLERRYYTTNDLWRIQSPKVSFF